MRNVRAPARWLLSLPLFAAHLACAAPPPGASAPAAPAASTVVGRAIDLAALDRTVDPCSDFYRFACGGWLDRNPVPDDRDAWSRVDSALELSIRRRLRELLEGRAGKISVYEKKIKDFYNACTDEVGIEKAGLKWLATLFEVIDAAVDKPGVARAFVALAESGFDAPLRIDAAADVTDPTRMIARVDASRWPLGSREAYLADDPAGRSRLAEYEAHVARVFVIAGRSTVEAAADAKAVVALETELARASLPLDQWLHLETIHHRKSLDEWKKEVPAIPWDGWLAALGLGGEAARVVDVGDLGAVTAIGARLQKSPPEAWRAYLRWLVLERIAELGPKALVEERARFEAGDGGRARPPLPRWERCVQATEDALGDALARAATVGDELDGLRARAQPIVDAIASALPREIDREPRLDPARRARWRGKVERTAIALGRPAQWRSYDALEIDRGSHLRNALHLALFERRARIDAIGRPADRQAWSVSPTSVAVRYRRDANLLMLPLGAFGSPALEPSMVAAARFGGVGARIAEAWLAAIDDVGDGFDDDGSPRTRVVAEPSSAEGPSVERRACLVDRLDHYAVPTEGGGAPERALRVDGARNADALFAEIAGLRVAWSAMKAEAAGRPEPTIDGYTAEQQFFIAYAQARCENVRPTEVARRLASGPWIPPKIAVDGALANLPELGAAFACKPPSAMVRAARCPAW
jgi:putative endopeptidase